jgi:uncharacterized protein (TIGR03435 family)
MPRKENNVAPLADSLARRNKLLLSAVACAVLVAPIIFVVANVAARSRSERQDHSAPEEQAQSQPAPQSAGKLSFDVVSIKLWQPNQPLPRMITGLRFHTMSIYAQCTDLQSLVRYAYHLTLAVPAKGLPDWASAQCGASNSFTFEATMPPEINEEQSRLMMQSALEDRFKMQIHWEKKEMQVLAMVIAPGGFKEKPYDPKVVVTFKPGSVNCPEDDQGCGMSFGRSTMARLADILGIGLGRPVIDKTGLTEEYPLNFMWANPKAETSSLPSLTTVLREKFGLLLKSETAMVDILVIDHVERPSPN